MSSVYWAVRKVVESQLIRIGFPAARKEYIARGLIARFLPPQPVMIDCGAHDGSDSLSLVEAFGGSVHAFEPNPAMFKRLSMNASRDSRVHSYAVALADYDGNAEFHVSSGASDASSSLLTPREHLRDHPEVEFNSVIAVPCLKLDTWAEIHQVQKVDFLWLDMQGYELKMLMASPRIVGSVSAIHTEVSTKETYAGVTLFPEFCAALDGLGFRLAATAVPEGWDQGNALFVRK